MDPNSDLSMGDLPSELRTIQEGKERLVANEGIGADVPTVAVLERDGHKLGGICSGPLCKFHWSAALCGTIVATRATNVMIVGETFIGPCESHEHAPGLDKRFAEGDPTVTEAIYVTLASITDLLALALPYRYNGRTVEWDVPDPDINEDPFFAAALFVAFSLRPLPVKVASVARCAKRYGVPWVDLAGNTHQVKPQKGFCQA